MNATTSTEEGRSVSNLLSSPTAGSFAEQCFREGVQDHYLAGFVEHELPHETHWELLDQAITDLASGFRTNLKLDGEPAFLVAGPGTVGGWTLWYLLGIAYENGRRGL